MTGRLITRVRRGFLRLLPLRLLAVRFLFSPQPSGSRPVGSRYSASIAIFTLFANFAPCTTHLSLIRPADEVGALPPALELHFWRVSAPLPALAALGPVPDIFGRPRLPLATDSPAPSLLDVDIVIPGVYRVGPRGVLDCPAGVETPSSVVCRISVTPGASPLCSSFNLITGSLSGTEPVPAGGAITAAGKSALPEKAAARHLPLTLFGLRRSILSGGPLTRYWGLPGIYWT